MKFSVKDFFSKYDQVRSLLRIWSHSLKKSSMENFILYSVTSAKLHQVTIKFHSFSKIL